MGGPVGWGQGGHQICHHGCLTCAATGSRQGIHTRELAASEYSRSYRVDKRRVYSPMSTSRGADTPAKEEVAGTLTSASMMLGGGSRQFVPGNVPATTVGQARRDPPPLLLLALCN